MWTVAIAVALFVITRRGDSISLPTRPTPGGAGGLRKMVPPWHRRGAAGPDDLQAVAAALVVGTAAGLSLQSSLELAGSALGAPRRREVDDVLRDARYLGLGTALARSDGEMSVLFARLARAQVSGAPLGATIAGFAAEEREIRRSACIEAARKLPVRLTIPLALLVLPGFVLLTAGPAAVGSLQRMLGPLMP